MMLCVRNEGAFATDFEITDPIRDSYWGSLPAPSPRIASPRIASLRIGSQIMTDPGTDNVSCGCAGAILTTDSCQKVFNSSTSGSV